MTHPCSTCKYAYFAKCQKAKSFYNAISDEMETGHETITESCCGQSPGGVVVDHNQPKCAGYEKK